MTIEVKVQYRKFDKAYMDFVTKSYKPGENKIRGYEPGQKYLNDLPVTTMAVDTVTFPVDGVAAEVEPQKSAIADLEMRADAEPIFSLTLNAELRSARPSERPAASGSSKARP